MATYSDDQSQSCKKLKSSETKANAGMRFGAQQPCVLYSKGKCTYGGNCRYAHTIGNVRETEGQRGHWRVTQRINFCQFFLSGRPCPYGENCRFLQESGGNKAYSGLGMSRQSSAKCILTNDDGTGKSKKLPNDPQNWVKTRLCGNWEKTRTCAYGSNCTFAQGNAELRRVNYPNPMVFSSGYALDTASKNAESRIVHQPREHGKPFLSKLADLKKNSEVYGDWIYKL